MWRLARPRQADGLDAFRASWNSGSRHKYRKWEAPDSHSGVFLFLDSGRRFDFPWTVSIRGDLKGRRLTAGDQFSNAGEIPYPFSASWHGRY